MFLNRKIFQYMKALNLFACLFLLSTTVQSQYLDWAGQLGGISEDVGVYVTHDPNGNVYSTGYFSSTVDLDPGTGTYTLTSSSIDTYLSKLDPNGNFSWALQVSGSSFIYPTRVKTDNDGNVYLAGRFVDSVFFDMDTLVAVNGFNYDMFLAKYSPNGDCIWVKPFQGSGDKSMLGLAIDGENIYCMGTFYETMDFDPGPGTENHTSLGQSDSFLIKLDTAGNYKWGQRFGGTDFDGAGFPEIRGKHIYFLGSLFGTADVEPGPGTTLLSSAGSVDGYVAKIDTSGNMIWAKNVVAGNFSGYVSSIVLDESENVYLAGDFQGTADFNPGTDINLMSSSDMLDIYITRLDSAGNYSWSKRIGGGNHDQCYAMCIDDNGFLYLTGEFYSDCDFDPEAGTHTLYADNWSEFYVVVLDSNGYFVLAEEFNGTHSARANSMSIDANKNLYLTGWFFHDVDFDPGAADYSIAAFGQRDAFVVKLNMPEVSVAEEETTIGLSVYPNPTHDKCTLRFGTVQEDIKVKIRSIDGQLTGTKHVSNTDQTELELPGSPGVYLVEVYGIDGFVTELKVVKQ